MGFGSCSFHGMTWSCYKRSKTLQENCCLKSAVLTLSIPESSSRIWVFSTKPVQSFGIFSFQQDLWNLAVFFGGMCTCSVKTLWDRRITLSFTFPLRWFYAQQIPSRKLSMASRVLWFCLGSWCLIPGSVPDSNRFEHRLWMIVIICGAVLFGECVCSSRPSWKFL